ncbi:Hypothetical protein SMAX5B_009793 [Scophthalmus maximus]|uniref:Uncharacterized protein n=1 Tax=Scophthalmus maximus TaxID=52904 RepID=A0A2U9BXP4_SCOMX|nr:Hypothetical protein SMAX5B_009793 [Scophthalmus maximus]
MPFPDPGPTVAGLDRGQAAAAPYLHLASPADRGRAEWTHNTTRGLPARGRIPASLGFIFLAVGILTGKQPLDKGSAQGQAGTDTRHLGNLLEEDRLLSAKDVGSRAEITLPR